MFLRRLHLTVKEMFQVMNDDDLWQYCGDEIIIHDSGMFTNQVSTYIESYMHFERKIRPYGTEYTKAQLSFYEHAQTDLK